MKRLILFILVVIFAATGWVLRESYISHAKTAAQGLAGVTDQATASQNLNDLKTYVSSHAGTSITVTLTADYNAALKAAQEAAASTPNAALYAAAQAACNGRGVSSVTQAQCNQDYIQSHTSGTTAANVPTPNLNDYTYHLTSPNIAPDAANAFFGLGIITLVVALVPRRKKSHLGSYL